ncbi:hypothetical protein GIB67_041040 [Kingdonia uniflora]|uniref:Repressor of RNA polymerase III transcription n=1 Tax=Kingdonia uniflora TaxID=39325 RepID=A0A7J7LG12_9MAGN|nr:hypothetical protein GIB67_041040 [Kingdonia uniflora]
MKFLEYSPFDKINEFLSDLSLGESIIHATLEAYSCKHSGTDRKLSLSFEHQILDCLGKSSPPDFFLASRASAVQAHHFFREELWEDFRQIFDTYMFEAVKEWSEANEGSSLLENLYKALDEVVKLGECEIYSYNPDSDGDPFLERGAIWSFNLFFYNRKLKRVVSFRCCCLSNLAADGFLANEMYDDEEEDIFNNMEM